MILHALGMFVAELFKSWSRLEAENLFLRHQLNIACGTWCATMTVPTDMSSRVGGGRWVSEKYKRQTITQRRLQHQQQTA